jgi:hypothetical protein
MCTVLTDPYVTDTGAALKQKKNLELPLDRMYKLDSESPTSPMDYSDALLPVHSAGPLASPDIRSHGTWIFVFWKFDY